MKQDRSRFHVNNAPSNSNYENDVRYNLQICQWVLKPIGVWPLIYSLTSKLEKIVSILLVTWYLFVSLFSLIPPGRYIIFVEKNPYKKLKLLAPLGFGFASLIKYCYLGVKGAAFKRCFVHVENDWKSVVEPNHRAIMLQQASVSRRLIGICAAFFYTAGMSYSAIMPFISKSRVKGNVTIRPLNYPGYDAFFDTQSSPTYEIIFTIHVFAGFIKYSVTAGTYSLTIIFITHICGQMQIQMARLENYVKESRMNRDPFRIIIRDHIGVLRLSTEVEEALSEICLTEIVESTIIICLLGLNCLLEWQNSDTIAIITYFVFLISFTFNIFIYCYVSQILKDQCSQIGPTSYGIDWFDLPPKKARYIILLNVISLHPPKLTAGKMIELNLITFSSVVQSSVVYFNLLRKLTE